MPLIRQSIIDPAGRDAVVLHLGDLGRLGERMKQSAREQAEAILAEAKAERDRIVSGAQAVGHAQGVERGFKEGRERGLAEGRAQALTEWRDRLTKLDKGWTDGLHAFLAERERLLLEARQDVLRLAVMLGEKVTKRTIEVDPSVVADQVAEVIALVARPTRVTLSVHPDDRSIVEEIAPGLRRRFPSAQEIEITTDGTLARGSCIARTAGGRIDASIGTQLARIARALLGDEARPLIEEPTPASVVTPLTAEAAIVAPPAATNAAAPAAPAPVVTQTATAGTTPSDPVAGSPIVPADAPQDAPSPEQLNNAEDPEGPTP